MVRKKTVKQRIGSIFGLWKPASEPKAFATSSVSGNKVVTSVAQEGTQQKAVPCDASVDSSTTSLVDMPLVASVRVEEDEAAAVSVRVDEDASTDDVEIVEQRNPEYESSGRTESSTERESYGESEATVVDGTRKWRTETPVQYFQAEETHTERDHRSESVTTNISIPQPEPQKKTRQRPKLSTVSPKVAAETRPPVSPIASIPEFARCNGQDSSKSKPSQVRDKASTDASPRVSKSTQNAKSDVRASPKSTSSEPSKVRKWLSGRRTPLLSLNGDSDAKSTSGSWTGHKGTTPRASNSRNGRLSPAPERKRSKSKSRSLKLLGRNRVPTPQGNSPASELFRSQNVSPTPTEKAVVAPIGTATSTAPTNEVKSVGPPPSPANTRGTVASPNTSVPSLSNVHSVSGINEADQSSASRGGDESIADAVVELVKYMSHREGRERGFEVLLDDYKEFMTVSMASIDEDTPVLSETRDFQSSKSAQAHDTISKSERSVLAESVFSAERVTPREELLQQNSQESAKSGVASLLSSTLAGFFQGPSKEVEDVASATSPKSRTSNPIADAASSLIPASLSGFALNASKDAGVSHAPAVPSERSRSVLSDVTGPKLEGPSSLQDENEKEDPEVQARHRSSKVLQVCGKLPIQPSVPDDDATKRETGGGSQIVMKETVASVKEEQTDSSVKGTASVDTKTMKTEGDNADVSQTTSRNGEAGPASSGASLRPGSVASFTSCPLDSEQLSAHSMLQESQSKEKVYSTPISSSQMSPISLQGSKSPSVLSRPLSPASFQGSRSPSALSVQPSPTSFQESRMLSALSAQPTSFQGSRSASVLSAQVSQGWSPSNMSSNPTNEDIVQDKKASSTVNDADPQDNTLKSGSQEELIKLSKSSSSQPNVTGGDSVTDLPLSKSNASSPFPDLLKGTTMSMQRCETPSTAGRRHTVSRASIGFVQASPSNLSANSKKSVGSKGTKGSSGASKNSTKGTEKSIATRILETLSRDSMGSRASRGSFSKPKDVLVKYSSQQDSGRRSTLSRANRLPPTQRPPTPTVARVDKYATEAEIGAHNGKVAIATMTSEGTDFTAKRDNEVFVETVTSASKSTE